jgi:hypothetical protein
MSGHPGTLDEQVSFTIDIPAKPWIGDKLPRERLDIRLQQAMRRSLYNPNAKSLVRNGSSLTNPVLWIIFGFYLLVAVYTMAHHELWFDEIHSWNIAKGSGNFFDLISNIRYEGHPPVWYIILWSISKFTHNLVYVQTVHVIIAALTVFLVLFCSPFPFTTKILMPFGYYFLYEYAILSRNYAMGVLLVFCICLIIRKTFRYKLLLYYSLVFLLSNTHMLGLFLGASLHFFFLLLNVEQKKKHSTIALHIFLGLLIFLPSVYFIFPPLDSQANIHFWVARWNIHKLPAFGQAPLFAFFPIPAWWTYNFWNTQFLIEGKTDYSILRLINPFVAMTILVLASVILKRSKKALNLFLANLLLSFIIAITVFTLTLERYAGFLFIGFMAAYWQYCYETAITTKNRYLVNAFLIVQLIGGVFIVSKDIHLPFSNAYRVNELLKEVPINEKTVTDYWAMNAVSAFVDRPFYCLDLQKEISFVNWESDTRILKSSRYRYFEGVRNLFQKQRINKVNMFSTGSPTKLFRADSLLFKFYEVRLFDKREGAIEKEGNLYLYQITSY